MIDIYENFSDMDDLEKYLISNKYDNYVTNTGRECFRKVIDVGGRWNNFPTIKKDNHKIGRSALKYYIEFNELLTSFSWEFGFFCRKTMGAVLWNYEAPKIFIEQIRRCEGEVYTFIKNIKQGSSMKFSSSESLLSFNVQGESKDITLICKIDKGLPTLVRKLDSILKPPRPKGRM